MIKRNYFVKDESLKNIDDDFFNHRDLADNLKKIIDTTNAPFNIAIIGKWGLGKSSLINLVLGQLNDKNKYLIQEINAWKYEKDEIGKAFLKQLWQGINGEKLTTFALLQREYTKFVKSILKDNPDDDGGKGKTISELVTPAIRLLLVTFIVYMLYTLFYQLYFEEYKNWIDMVADSFFGYGKDIGKLFFIPLLVWMGKIFLDNQNADRRKKIEISFPIESKDDYEVYLENKLKEKLNKNPDLKIITVIDDLDRLSPKKIVEALDALKGFMDFKQCIFIVPFDDTIIKKVLDQEKIQNDYNNYIHGELILDKLFQYKIYLPELIKNDIKKYSFNIFLKDCSDFCSEYIDSNIPIDRIVKNILIHSNVTTPRQVKKIINTFVSNIMLAKARESVGKVERNFCSSIEGIRQVAIISVLQADFADFYTLLFEDVNLINEILEIHRLEKTEPSKLIKDYFIEENSIYLIKKEYLPLINFLIYVEKYNTKSLISYLYMMQDSISVKTGDKKQQEFIAAAESKNIITVKDEIEKTPILVDSLINYLSYTDDLDVLGNLFITGMNVLDVCSSEKRRDLLYILSDRIPELISDKIEISIQEMNFNNIFLAMKVLKQSYFIKLIEYFLKNYKIEIKDFDFIYKMIKALIYNYDLIEDNAISSFKKIIYSLYENEELSSKELLSVVNLFISGNSIIFNDYLSYSVLLKISHYIDTDNDFSTEVVDAFKFLFSINIKPENINKNLVSINELFSYVELHETFAEILSKDLYDSLNNRGRVAIVDRIVDIDDENYNEYTFKLLELIEYDLDEDTDYTVYDNFYFKLLKYEQFPNVIMSYNPNSDFKELAKTVKELIDNSFNTLDFTNNLIILINRFSPEQKNYFFNTLTSKSGYNSSTDYKCIIKMFDSLNDIEYFEKLEAIYNSTVFNGFNSYYNQDNYFHFVKEITKILIEDIDQSTISKYLTIVNNINSSIVLEWYMIVNNYVSEKDYIVLIKNAVKYVNNQTFNDIYHLISTHISWFNDTNSNFDMLAEFYVLNIKYAGDKIKFIRDLDKNIPVLNEPRVKLLIENIIEEELDIDDILDILMRYFNQLEDIEKINILLSLINDKDNYEIAEKLYKNSKISEDNFIENYALTKNLKCEDYLMIVDFIVEIKYFNDSTIKLFDTITDTFSEFTTLTKLVDIIQKIDKSSYKNFKEKISNSLYKIYNSTSSKELKKRIVDIIALHKLTSFFKEKLDDEQKKEFNNLR